MKTKIIYISGNEVFDMADIRAAFEEVRGALGLGPDTVMFGVPVDADDALTAATPDVIAPVTATATEEEIVATAQAEIPEPIADIASPDATETDITEVPAPAPKKAARRGRPKKIESAAADTPIVTIDEEPAIADKPDEVADAAAEKVIPILSVLATKNVATDAPDADDADEAAPAAVIADIDINAELAAPAMDENAENADTIRVTIGDMINDDVPVAPREKTLEELLESMTPLREDHDADITQDDAADSHAEIIEEDMPIIHPADDGDATLEQLAAEFAQTEDTLPPAPRPESHGKIGKLKNILPFKKAKREDSGLMGDLFGWAGIAANDEDFSIPGFFTPTAAKK